MINTYRIDFKKYINIDDLEYIMINGDKYKADLIYLESARFALQYILLMIINQKGTLDMNVKNVELDELAEEADIVIKGRKIKHG